MSSSTVGSFNVITAVRLVEKKTKLLPPVPPWHTKLSERAIPLPTGGFLNSTKVLLSFFFFPFTVHGHTLIKDTQIQHNLYLQGLEGNFVETGQSLG